MCVSITRFLISSPLWAEMEPEWRVMAGGVDIKPGSLGRVRMKDFQIQWGDWQLSRGRRDQLGELKLSQASSAAAPPAPAPMGAMKRRV